MNLHIEKRRKENVHIIDIQGEVDLYSSPTMRESIFKTLKQDRPETLIVELSRVTYLDSSGIATLVEGLQISNQYQTRFKLAGLSPTVLEVFQLARLERVFDIYPTEKDALSAT